MKAINSVLLFSVFFLLNSCALISSSSFEGKDLVEFDESDLNNNSDCQNIPTKLSDLDGGFKKYVYFVSSSNSTKLEALGYGGAYLQKDESILVIDFMQHKDVFCSNENITRYGVGARLFLRINKKSRKFSTGLSKLAASVELGKASVEFSLTTIGITGDKIKDLLPKGHEFDVDNYTQVVNAIDEIIELTKDNVDGINIAPQIIPN